MPVVARFCVQRYEFIWILRYFFVTLHQISANNYATQDRRNRI